jgi:hypothetical protein
VPDFANKKAAPKEPLGVPSPAKKDESARKPAVHGLTEGRPAATKSESARDAFARLNYNLQDGFKRLENKLGAAATKEEKPKPIEPLAAATKDPKSNEFGARQNVYNYEYNTNSYVSTGKGDKGQVKGPESLFAGKPAAIRSMERGPATAKGQQAPAPAASRAASGPAAPSGSIRQAHEPHGAAPSSVAPVGQAHEPHGAAPSSVAPVADKRAYANFTRRDQPKPEADATRMAKLVEADKKIKAGEIPPNAKIQEWAADIKGGRQRAVADLDPRSVKQTVERAVGGEQAAHKLNTPAVAHLETEHQTRSQVLQKGLDSRREAVARAQTPAPGRSGSQSAIHAVESSRAVSKPESRNFPAARDGATNPVHASRAQNPEMTSMLRYNDASHDLEAASRIGNLTSATGPAAQPTPADGTRSDVKPIQSSKMEGAKQGAVHKLETASNAKIDSIGTMQAFQKPAGGAPSKFEQPGWTKDQGLRSLDASMNKVLDAIRKGSADAY